MVCAELGGRSCHPVALHVPCLPYTEEQLDCEIIRLQTFGFGMIMNSSWCLSKKKKALKTKKKHKKKSSTLLWPSLARQIHHLLWKVTRLTQTGTAREPGPRKHEEKGAAECAMHMALCCCSVSAWAIWLIWCASTNKKLLQLVLTLLFLTCVLSQSLPCS